MLATLLCMIIGDEWRLPPAQRLSSDNRLMLSIEGKSHKAPVHLTLKRRSANGWRTVWSARSPQEGAPYIVHFAPNNRVVLQDQWANLGSGVVLAFLGSDGKTIKTYTLNEFLPKEDQYGAMRSVSSVWWHRSGQVGIRKNGDEFVVVTARKTYRVFDLSTGAMKLMTPQLKSDVLAELIRDTRPRLAHADKFTRAEAARFLWVLEDRESIPALVKLLEDPSYQRVTISGGSGIPDGSYRNYLVQYAAGETLLRFDRKRFLPLIERKIKKADRYMAEQWSQLVASGQGVTEAPSLTMEK